MKGRVDREKRVEEGGCSVSAGGIVRVEPPYTAEAVLYTLHHYTLCCCCVLKHCVVVVLARGYTSELNSSIYTTNENNLKIST